MLLRLCVRRHLLARLDKGAILALARVIVADLTPATKLSEDVAESDLVCEERISSGVGSKSSRVHRWSRGVTVGGCCCLRRRRELSQRRNGLDDSSSSLSSSSSRMSVRAFWLWMTLWKDVELPELGEERSSSSVWGAIFKVSCVCGDVDRTAAYGVEVYLVFTLPRQNRPERAHGWGMAVKSSDQIGTYLLSHSIPLLTAHLLNPTSCASLWDVVNDAGSAEKKRRWTS